MFRRTALITAAVVVSAGLALSGCSAGSGTGAGSGSGSSSGASAPQAAGLNTPVTVGTFEYTVTGTKDAGTTLGTSPLSKTAQGSFVEVDIVVKNVGDKSAMFLSQYVKLVDAGGKTYDPDSTASLYANPNNQAWLAAINPGNSLTGPVFFDVPAGTKPVGVQVTDGPMSKGQTINLG